MLAPSPPAGTPTGEGAIRIVTASRGRECDGHMSPMDEVGTDGMCPASSAKVTVKETRGTPRERIVARMDRQLILPGAADGTAAAEDRA